MQSILSEPPKGFKHSIGAELFSESLDGCKFYSELSIGYQAEIGNSVGYFRPGKSFQKMKGNPTELLSFKCLIFVAFSTALDKWYINLYPVEIEKNKIVKEFLMKTGLPLIKDWLDSEKNETWFMGHRVFQIGIKEDMQEFCFLESQDDKVINKGVKDFPLIN